jgi:hypothetical protein
MALAIRIRGGDGASKSRRAVAKSAIQRANQCPWATAVFVGEKSVIDGEIENREGEARNLNNFDISYSNLGAA